MVFLLPISAKNPHATGMQYKAARVGRLPKSKFTNSESSLKHCGQKQGASDSDLI